MSFKIELSLGNLAQALAHYEKDAQLSKELYKSYPENVSFKNRLAISYSQLGRFYQNKLEELERARSYLHLAQQLWKELNNAFPNYAEFSKNLNWVNNVLKDL